MSYYQSREPIAAPPQRETAFGMGYEQLGALAWALIALSFALVTLSAWLT